MRRRPSLRDHRSNHQKVNARVPLTSSSQEDCERKVCSCFGVVGGAALATLLTSVTFLSSPGPYAWRTALNRGIGLALFWMISLLLVRARRHQVFLADSEAWSEKDCGRCSTADGIFSGNLRCAGLHLDGRNAVGSDVGDDLVSWFEPDHRLECAESGVRESDAMALLTAGLADPPPAGRQPVGSPPVCDLPG